jgi:hypothetical protein
MDFHLQSETLEPTSFAKLQWTCLENICRLLKTEGHLSCLFTHVPNAELRCVVGCFVMGCVNAHMNVKEGTRIEEMLVEGGNIFRKGSHNLIL